MHAVPQPAGTVFLMTQHSTFDTHRCLFPVQPQRSPELPQ